MKKLLVALCLLLVLFSTCTAFADMPADMPTEIAGLIADGEKWTGWMMTDYVCPDGGDTAFVAMNKDEENMLLCFRKQEGIWKLSWSRNNAVPQGVDGLSLSERSNSTYAGLTLDTAFSLRLAVPGAWESIYELDNDIWRLRAIVYCDTDGTPIEFFTVNSNHVLYSGWKKEGKVKLYGMVQTDLRYYSYSDFETDPDQLKKSLSNPPSVPSGELAAQSIKFTGGRKYEVYQGPGEGYGRGGNGKAAVSTNDWIQVFGREDGWIMIQYDLSRDHMRIGWIRESALPSGVQVPELRFSSRAAYTTRSVSLTDDPLFTGDTVLTLPQGAWVEWLATMGEWAYVESSTGDQIRGFVPRSALTTDAVFHLENHPDQSLQQYPLRGTLTIASSGKVTLAITSADVRPNGQDAAVFMLYDATTGQKLAAATRSADGFYGQGTADPDVYDLLIVPVDAQGYEDRTQAISIQR